jgi:signal transduction histidine kinase
MPPSRHHRGRGLAAVEAPHPDFELLFRSAPSLLVVLDAAPGFRILAASDAYLRATRSARESVLGRPFFEAYPETGEGPRITGAGSLRSALERVLASSRADALNTPVRGPDGRLRYIIHRIDALELEVLRGARERDEALREMRAAQDALDSFVHSAAHDLRGPLHAIDGSCRMYEELQGPSLNGETRRLLARIGVNVNRMENIIEGLLGLSRAGRIHMARKRVDVTSIAKHVVAKLHNHEPERFVVVDIAEGLEAWADESLVSIVLEHVIANAWKFTRRRPDARIVVGMRSLAGQQVFEVRDNGVGFDMAYADRLFAPFVRLHDGPEYEGHGIGLASVKRIVERHGGEIWAESQVDRGTTIHFTLSGPGI